MSFNWHIIRTKPRSEHQAAVELENAGNTVFYPRLKSAGTHQSTLDKPVFPGYLFIHCDLDQPNPPNLEFAPHTAGWVKFERIVPVVPDETVTALINKIEAVNNGVRPWVKLYAGQKVRLEYKAMDTVATVVEESSSGKGYVKVLLDFMNRQVMARVPWEHVLPSDPADSHLESVDAEIPDPIFTTPQLPAVKNAQPQHPPRRTRGRGRWIKPYGPRQASLVP